MYGPAPNSVNANSALFRRKRPRLPLWSVTLLVLSSASAEARSQLNLGVRTGANLVHRNSLPIGLLIGADATVRLHRLWAIELAATRSFHWAARAGQTTREELSTYSAALQYRIDIARVVPYVDVGAEWVRSSVHQPGAHLAALLALGFFAPFTQRFFWGAEVRYATVPGSAFPGRQSLVLRGGWYWPEF